MLVLARVASTCLVLAFLAVAGCLEKGPTDEGGATQSTTTTTTPPDPDQVEQVFTPTVSENATVPVRWFNGSFDLSLSEVNSVFHSYSGTNCLDVEGAPFQIANLTLALTWTARTPLEGSLELVVMEFFGSYEERVSGPSPLALRLPDPLPPADAEDGNGFEEFYLFAAQLADPGATYELPAKLDVSFQYVSDTDIEATLGACALG